MIKKYDEKIKAAAGICLPGADWRLLKAQLSAESNLNPNAKSPVGAMGIAQFMPATWKQMQSELKLALEMSAYDANHAIPAAAYYMEKLCNKWSSEREEADRYCLALASYNAGFGNLLKAQKLAGGAVEYGPIIAKLHEVTGDKNSAETREYVKRIFRIFGEYLMEGR